MPDTSGLKKAVYDMQTYRIEDITIKLNREGADKYIKISYPIRYGIFHEIRTPDYTFQFNLNGEIKTIQGRGEGWLDASEWLKRTAGNDWAYFSAGGYSGAYDFTGEYYVPCFEYETNSVLFRNHFSSPDVERAFEAWHKLRTRLSEIDSSGLDPEAAAFIKKAAETGPDELEERARRFHGIIGGQVSVLPPDTRHVEYDVIPLIAADGCLYNCSFCRVKSGVPFTLRTQEDILRQIRELRAFYDKDIINYNSIFLGQHDALFADKEMLEFAARRAYEGLEIENSVMKEPRLFLFGSVDSMLRSDDDVFEMINSLPFYTYINLGLESADEETFKVIGKPLTPKKVKQAFSRMMEVNSQFSRIEITANFIYGARLPENHLPSIIELTRSGLNRFYSKGTIYVSPLEDIGSKEEMKRVFSEFKKMCRLPCYIYLIQRL